jgi:hypothetical protein
MKALIAALAVLAVIVLCAISIGGRVPSVDASDKRGRIVR